MNILVVEDEVKLANAIKRALEIQTYAVTVAYDGQTGLDLAVSEELDLIILDLMLPKIDGLEICRMIRNQGIHTPVLILTAKGLVSDKINGLDTGADDYMVKPFSFEELFARIRALTRRPRHVINPVLTVEDLLLDPSKFTVSRNEIGISLSSKEFALLEYLMRNKGSILTKTQIIGHIWDYDADVLPNVVEVHIKHLRDKVDKPFEKPLIMTVRGFGYMIGAKE
ncbi:response regulator transcription factor [candidate division WWE3 bacterium]|nr:response regulator transcription factor [candidate division WWE3 bacterium]